MGLIIKDFFWPEPCRTALPPPEAQVHNNLADDPPVHVRYATTHNN